MGAQGKAICSNASDTLQDPLMMRLLEPRKQEVERFVPFPERALTNGRPRSVVLSGSRHKHSTGLDSGAVRTNASANAAPPGRLQSSATMGRRPVGRSASIPRRRSSAASSKSDVAGALARKALEATRKAHGMDPDMDSGAVAPAATPQQQHHARASFLKNADATDGVAQRESVKVPGLEGCGVTAESLDDAGILYDEERYLLGPAVQAVDASEDAGSARGGSHASSSGRRASDGGALASGRRGTGDTRAGGSAAGGSVTGGPSVRVDGGEEVLGATKLRRPSSAPPPNTASKPKVGFPLRSDERWTGRHSLSVLQLL